MRDQRQQGFVKADDGKPRVELLPPLALLEVGRVLGHGAEEYGAYSWRAIDNRGRYRAAALRHILAYQGGENVDPGSGLPTLAHAACSVLFALEADISDLGADDRPGASRG